jgi:hypothetical protein
LTLEVLQPETAHPKLAQVVAIATGGWETPHEFGLAHCVRGRGPAAATLQAHKCRRSVAPRGVQPVDAASNQIGCCLSPMAATRDGRYRSFGGGNERPPLICELPLTPSYRSSYIENLAF